jgi:hypothetical protein
MPYAARRRRRAARANGATPLIDPITGCAAHDQSTPPDRLHPRPNPFNIPEAGLPLLPGIDRFLEMARPATNVIGIATALIARPEGELLPAPLKQDAAVAELP